MKCVLVLLLISFGVVFDEISVWKFDIVLYVIVMNRNGNRLFDYIGFVLLMNFVSVGIFSFGVMIRMLIVRLRIVLIFRNVDRQLCGVSSSYIGSIDVMKLQLIRIYVSCVLLNVNYVVSVGELCICWLNVIDVISSMKLMIDILLMWFGWMQCVQMFMNNVIGIVVVMVNVFYGELVSVFMMISVSIVRMIIMIRNVLNSVIMLGIVFSFILMRLLSEWLLWCVEMNSMMKFCIVLVNMMLVRIYSMLGVQFICVVSMGLISGLVLVIVVK